MNRLAFAASFVCAAVIAPHTALAAEPARGPAPKTASVGADAAFVLPIGNLSDAAGPGFGALVRFDYRVADAVSVGARAGYVFHLSKDVGGGSTGISETPIFAAARYHFMGREENGPYAAAELGPAIVFGRATTQGVTSSSSDMKFGGSLGGGYTLGKIDLRAQMLVLDVGHLGDTIAIAATVGYAFAAF